MSDTPLSATPAKIHIGEIDPDYRKHDGRFRLFCYRCGRGLQPKSVACSIRLVMNMDGTWLVNAFWPMGGQYYAIGPECVKRIPAEFQMEREAVI